MVWSMTADLFLNPEWRSGAVVSTVASSEGLGSVPGSKAFFFFFFMCNLHILYVFCVNTDFLPQSENAHIRLAGGLNSL